MKCKRITWIEDTHIKWGAKNKYVNNAQWKAQRRGGGGGLGRAYYNVVALTSWDIWLTSAAAPVIAIGISNEVVGCFWCCNWVSYNSSWSMGSDLSTDVGRRNCSVTWNCALEPANALGWTVSAFFLRHFASVARHFAYSVSEPRSSWFGRNRLISEDGLFGTELLMVLALVECNLSDAVAAKNSDSIISYRHMNKLKVSFTEFIRLKSIFIFNMMMLVLV